MQASTVPTKFPIPWAATASGTYSAPVPKDSQIGITNGAASLTDGFPPLNFAPVGSGGVPPFGKDTNGILKQITQWCQWYSAGGPIAWDSVFSTAIGGYPAGASVGSAVTAGLFFLSLVDNNTTNPDTGGAGWKPFFIAHGGEDYYVDSGSVNALVITPTPALTVLNDGYTFTVDPGFANTGAVTLAVSGLTAVPIVNPDGSSLVAGEVVPGTLMRLSYLGGNFQWLNAPWSVTRAPGDNSQKIATTAYADLAATTAAANAATTPGYLYGLATGPTPSFTSTRITVQAGQCRSSTNDATIVLGSALTKRLDQGWTAGNNNGGRDTGSLAAGQTWHIFVIFDPTHNLQDALFSQSPTTPNLPTNYTKFRRIGALVLDGSSNIRPYLQTGDWFKYQVAVLEFNSANNGSGPYTRTMTGIPTGVKVEGEFWLASTSNPGFGTPHATGVSIIWDPDLGSVLGHGDWGQVRWWTSDTTAGRFQTSVVRQFTNNAAQVVTYSPDPSDQIEIDTLGWRDRRGQHGLP